ncbi:MAG: ribosome maturation factor RimM [Actinomycetota bacterium]
MERLSDPVVIGVVASPHGVRGTIRVRPSGSGRHLREGIEPLIAGIRRRIMRSRETPKGYLVDLEGVGDRSEAARLRGEELVLDRSELDEPEEGEFYVADLVGLLAVDESGKGIGTVSATFETPAHEVLVIETEAEELYLPFTREHVPKVSLGEGRLVARPPREG